MNVFKDNEGYWWRIGGTLNHWHAEFTSWGRDYREESVNDTGLWWLVRPSFIIISLKYNSELQRQILEAQKHQFLHQKSSCGDLVKKNFIGRGHCPLPRSAPSPDPSPSEEEDTLPHTPFPSAPTGPRGPRLLRLQRSTSICSTPHHFLHPQVFIF